MQFCGLKSGVMTRFFEGIKKAPVFWAILSVQNGKSEIRDFVKRAKKNPSDIAAEGFFNFP